MARSCSSSRSRSAPGGQRLDRREATRDVGERFGGTALAGRRHRRGKPPLGRCGVAAGRQQMLRQHLGDAPAVILAEHRIGHRPVQPPPLGSAQRGVDGVLHQRMLEARGGAAAHAVVAMRDVGGLQRVERLAERVVGELGKPLHQLQVEYAADRGADARHLLGVRIEPVELVLHQAAERQRDAA